MRASAYCFYFIRKERARTETIFGFQFIAINSSAHTSTLILCVYMWWLTKPISTLFHVNMKFFGILITFQTKIVKHAKPKRRRKKKYMKKNNSTIVCILWYGTAASRKITTHFFFNNTKKNIVWNKRKCKIISNGKSMGVI